jgi:hypothetical protein
MKGDRRSRLFISPKGAFSYYGARFAKDPLKNIAVSTTPLVIASSLAVRHLNGLHNGPWRHAAMICFAD